MPSHEDTAEYGDVLERIYGPVTAAGALFSLAGAVYCALYRLWFPALVLLRVAGFLSWSNRRGIDRGDSVAA